MATIAGGETEGSQLCGGTRLGMVIYSFIKTGPRRGRVEAWHERYFLITRNSRAVLHGKDFKQG